jgi:uncharacterized protein (DUF2141 family)
MKFLILLLSFNLFSAKLVTNLASKKNQGTVYCSVFDQVKGFPGTSKLAIAYQAVPVKNKKAICQFNLKPNKHYAIGILHDLNGNKRLDTNILGIPKEPWGVSNNIRPKFRAPNFDEAKFYFKENQIINISLK